MIDEAQRNLIPFFVFNGHFNVKMVLVLRDDEKNFAKKDAVTRENLEATGLIHK